MSVTIEVYARRYWNNTNYSLRSGRQYQVTASGFWHDAWIKCGPDGYSSPNWLVERFEQYRRAPKQDWFVLIGAVDQDKATYFKSEARSPSRRTSPAPDERQVAQSRSLLSGL